MQEKMSLKQIYDYIAPLIDKSLGSPGYDPRWAEQKATLIIHSIDGDDITININEDDES